VCLGVTPICAIVSAAIGRSLPAPELDASVGPSAVLSADVPSWLWAARHLATIADSTLYAFLPWWATVLIRLVQGRPWLHRVAGRSILIGDVPWVAQSAEAFASKLFALSYSIASCSFASANPADHLVHRHTHRVRRGSLLAVGRPDGRLNALTTAEAACTLAVNQASSIQNFGVTCESITIGHSSYKLPLSTAHLQLPTARPLFACEVLREMMLEGEDADSRPASLEGSRHSRLDGSRHGGLDGSRHRPPSGSSSHHLSRVPSRSSLIFRGASRGATPKATPDNSVHRGKDSTKDSVVDPRASASRWLLEAEACDGGAPAAARGLNNPPRVSREPTVNGGMKALDFFACASQRYNSSPPRVSREPTVDGSMPALDELASVNLRYNTSPGSKGSGSAGSGSLMPRSVSYGSIGAAAPGLGVLSSRERKEKERFIPFSSLLNQLAGAEGSKHGGTHFSRPSSVHGGAHFSRPSSVHGGAHFSRPSSVHGGAHFSRPSSVHGGTQFRLTATAGLGGGRPVGGSPPPPSQIASSDATPENVMLALTAAFGGHAGGPTTPRAQPRLYASYEGEGEGEAGFLDAQALEPPRMLEGYSASPLYASNETSRHASRAGSKESTAMHVQGLPPTAMPFSAALASIAVEGSPRVTLGVSLSPPTDEVLKTASELPPAGSRSPGISARSPAGSRSPLPTPPPSPPPSMATTNQLRLPSLQRQRPWPVLPPPSRLGRGSRAPTQAPAAPAEEPKLPPKRQLTQPKPPPNGKNDAPNAIKAKLQSVENSLIKAKRSRKLFDREARAFNSESLAAFQDVVFELAPIDEPFLGAWMMSSEQHCNCTTTELLERQRLVQARALSACGSRTSAHHSSYECP
jgi:hypothetical protein